MIDGAPINVLDYGATGDGVTDDTAAIQAPIAAALTNGKSVFIPAGTYILQGTLNGGTKLKLFGEGVGLTILKKKTASGGHILDFYGTTNKEDIVINGISFDCNLIDAGVYCEYVTNFTFSNCEVKDTPYWGLVIGLVTGALTTIANNNVTIQNCVFNNNTQTYEHVLVFNSENVLVDNCYFTTSANGIGVGIYQWTTNVTVSNCYFTNLKKAAYYSVTCDNTKFINCTFKHNEEGVQGGNESDNGLFGVSYVYNITFDTCYFEDIYNASYALELGRTNGAIVNNCTFYNNYGSGILINDRGIGTAAGTPSINTTISNSVFRNNNASGGGSINLPSIKFETSNASLRTLISNCIIYDDRAIPFALYPIVFAGSTISDVNIINCQLSAYSGGQSVGINLATIGNNVWVIDCQNTTNTIGIGIRRKMSGNGTPEATVTAGIGSIFSRLDGGAGTSLYVKESGTGNTGWVGK
jgi:hypothetical protein